MQSNIADPKPAEDDGYSIARRIQYSFTLQNTSALVIENADLWTFAPVKLTAHQRCLTIQSNYPHQLITDNRGNQVLHFIVENLAPYGSRVVTVKADLLVSAAANSTPLGPVSQDFSPQKYIESDHPEIKRLAQTLRANDTIKTVEEVYGWVTSHLSYSGYTDKNRGALYALENRHGDCTEYADLFVALCRANHVPARPVGGYVCPRNGVLKASDYHNWSEFYEHGTWQLADPQKRVLMHHEADYIAMRILHASEDDPMGSFQRFRVRGEGLSVRMH